MARLSKPEELDRKPDQDNVKSVRSNDVWVTRCVKNITADLETRMNAAENETPCSDGEQEKTGVETQTSSANNLVDVIRYIIHCCDYQPCSYTAESVAVLGSKTGCAMLQSLHGFLGCPSILSLPINLWNFQTREFAPLVVVQADFKFSSISIDTTK